MHARIRGGWGQVGSPTPNGDRSISNKLDGPESSTQPHPFCLWRSYHYKQWWTLLVSNKTAQNIKLKALQKAGYLFPSSPHEDKMSGSSFSYLGHAWTSCSKITWAWKTSSSHSIAERWERAVTEGENGTRRQLAAQGAPCAVRDFVSLLNCLWI